MNPAMRERLTDVVERMPRDVYAVVDGARFDDFPREAMQAGLSSRPLFLEADSDLVAAGPHLVPLPDRATTVRVLDLVGDRPAAVFWSWPDDENGLHRHLRKLNRVEIPMEGSKAAEDRYEAVLFRHADPNVLAAVLPILELDQFGEFLGKSNGVAMIAPDFGGLRIVPRPAGLA